MLPEPPLGLPASLVIGAGVVPVTCLTEIFCQAAESRIIVNAQGINNGQMPEWVTAKDLASTGGRS